MSQGIAKAPELDLPDRMGQTADEWFKEAAEKEDQANQLRREELRLRVEIVGLRAAAQGMRAAMAERGEYAERMQSVIHQEQDRDAEATDSAKATRSWN